MISFIPTFVRAKGPPGGRPLGRCGLTLIWALIVGSACFYVWAIITWLYGG
jgi:hypothetical protein